MRTLSAVLAVCLAVACNKSTPTAPLRRVPLGASRVSTSSGPDIVVMTQNIGPGANMDPLLAAQDPKTIPFLAAEAWAMLQASDLPGRAQAVARLIATNRPQLVGLQEVALYRMQHPSDAIVGGTTPATTIVDDYLQILLDALHALGADYRAMVVVPGTDAEVPMLTGAGPDGPTFDDVRFTDRDVILARGDVPITNPLGGLYRARLPLALGGGGAFVVRGWASVDAHVGEGTVRFFSTHLEDQHNPPIQLLQAEELANLVHVSPHPVVLVGDFNSAANVYQTPTYGFLTGAGKLVDMWPIANPGVAGLACCHPDALNEPDWWNAFDQRLDFVFLSNARSSAAPSPATHERWNDWVYAALHASVIGLDPADRTASGLWPSDHAGVLATLRLSEKSKP
ncbi:MAG TPA: endonuclease/exonuclease/phosphatase family protein [Gemmatimonadaceae bacterium]|nr:endonuclease/exonuclease/phosphatase family protein [Gemmatimonadaceae bacterium]